MIKIIPNFLSYPLFKYLKRIVENEKGMLWNFNPRNLQPQIKTKGSENYKLGKTLYCVAELCDNGKEVYDNLNSFYNFVGQYFSNGKLGGIRVIAKKLATGYSK